MTKTTPFFICLSLLSALELPALSEQIETAPSSNEVPQNALTLFHRSIAKSFSMKGDFSQQVQCAGDSAPPPLFQGTFEIKRKGKYRFTYTRPHGILLVSDGNTTHVYNKHAGLVLTGSENASIQASLARLLLGETVEDFDVATMQPKDATSSEFTVLNLEPRMPDPFVRRVLLTLSTESPFLKRVVIVDSGGCIIQTTLTNVQIDTGIKNKRFQFVPPKNATIVSP